MKRRKTGGRIIESSGVAEERVCPIGRVVETVRTVDGGGVIERLEAGGGIVEPAGIVRERVRPGCRVLGPACIVPERIIASGRVIVGITVK